MRVTKSNRGATGPSAGWSSVRVNDQWQVFPVMPIVRPRTSRSTDSRGTAANAVIRLILAACAVGCQTANRHVVSSELPAVSSLANAESSIDEDTRKSPKAVPDRVRQTAAESASRAEEPRTTPTVLAEDSACRGDDVDRMRLIRRRLSTKTEDLLERLGDDAVGATNWNNAAILGVALGGALGVRNNLDNDVRESVARDPLRWGDGSRRLGNVGEPQYQAAGLAIMYGISHRYGNERLGETADSLFSALTLTGVTTLAIKGIANTDRPSDEWNGGEYGFPSYHTASTFAIAAVLDDYYGPRVGLPAFAVAGLVGWSRIDERDHDLSDVLFGAALGYVIGKSVSGRQLRGDGRVRLLPYVHPTEGSGGLILDIAY